MICQPQVIGMRRSVYRKSLKSRKSSAKESKQHKADQSNFDPKSDSRGIGIRLDRIILTLIAFRLFAS